MQVPFHPDLLIADILRGTVGRTPSPVAPHRLPLCTYCDHSHLDHHERQDPDHPGRTLRPCARYPPCDCRNFRDPDVKTKKETEGITRKSEESSTG